MGILALASAIAVAVPQPAVAPPDASPAIYRVSDSDTTVYIFGTFHALDSRDDWFNDRVRTAFDASQELVLETIVPQPDSPGAVPLPAFRAPRVTPSASFLGTTRLAIDAGRSNGMSVAHGADMVLRRAAEHDGKHVDGLETIESQLAMFARMPAPASGGGGAPGSPKATTGAGQAQPANMSSAMVMMQSAWKRGDQAVFAAMLEQMRRTSPSLYRLMFTERNSRWADWIAGRMQTPGIIFVAVGAGHLAGRDSVLVRLAELGIESTRVQ